MKGGQRWHPFLSKNSRMTTTTYDQATDLLVLLTAASDPKKQDATIRAQLFFDHHMKDFDYIVPNTISYNILVEAYAKNGGDKTLDSNFNLVEEAHNAQGVLLDSTFQWWNIVFV